MVHQLYQPGNTSKSVLSHTKMTEKHNSTVLETEVEGLNVRAEDKCRRTVLFGGHRGVLAVQGTNAGGYKEIQ